MWWDPLGRLRDRLSPDDVQTMIELRRPGSTAKQVAQKFDVSLRSAKRVLHQHSVARRKPKASLISNVKPHGVPFHPLGGVQHAAE
ncbi:MAG: helix-turn-helix domain-containing protein [Pseudonocardiaceae bacterium]